MKDTLTQKCLLSTDAQKTIQNIDIELTGCANLSEAAYQRYMNTMQDAMTQFDQSTDIQSSCLLKIASKMDSKQASDANTKSETDTTMGPLGAVAAMVKSVGDAAAFGATNLFSGIGKGFENEGAATEKLAEEAPYIAAFIVGGIVIIVFVLIIKAIKNKNTSASCHKRSIRHMICRRRRNSPRRRRNSPRRRRLSPRRRRNFPPRRRRNSARRRRKSPRRCRRKSPRRRRRKSPRRRRRNSPPLDSRITRAEVSDLVHSLIYPQEI